MRAIQEFLAHADSKTTQIYAPSEDERQIVNEALAALDLRPDEEQLPASDEEEGCAEG